jgi:hypothetical protein
MIITGKRKLDQIYLLTLKLLTIASFEAGKN